MGGAKPHVNRTNKVLLSKPLGLAHRLVSRPVFQLRSLAQHRRSLLYFEQANESHFPAKSVLDQLMVYFRPPSSHLISFSQIEREDIWKVWQSGFSAKSALLPEYW